MPLSFSSIKGTTPTFHANRPDLLGSFQQILIPLQHLQQLPPRLVFILNLAIALAPAAKCLAQEVLVFSRLGAESLLHINSISAIHLLRLLNRPAGGKDEREKKSSPVNGQKTCDIPQRPPSASCHFPSSLEHQHYLPASRAQRHGKTSPSLLPRLRGRGSRCRGMAQCAWGRNLAARAFDYARR